MTLTVYKKVGYLKNYIKGKKTFYFINISYENNPFYFRKISYDTDVAIRFADSMAIV